MKKALKLVLTYFILLVVGILAGTILYSFFLSVLNHVSGTKFSFFNKYDLVKSFFYVSVCYCFFICPVVTYYKIRHAGGFPQFIAYIIVACITWLVIFPFSIHLGLKWDFDSYRSKDTESLSQGFFREGDNKIFYFTEDFKENQNKGKEASAIIIDKSQTGGVAYSQVEDYPDLVLYREAYPYRDIVIRDVFEKSAMPKIISMRLLVYRAVIAMDKGWSFFLAYLSIGLLICSIYGLSHFFEWRLMNTSIVMLSTCAVFILNTVYFMPAFDAFRMKYIDSNSLFISLGKVMDDPILVFTNVLFSLVFMIIGLVRYIKTKKKMEI